MYLACSRNREEAVRLEGSERGRLGGHGDNLERKDAGGSGVEMSLRQILLNKELQVNIRNQMNIQMTVD